MSVTYLFKNTVNVTAVRKDGTRLPLFLIVDALFLKKNLALFIDDIDPAIPIFCLAVQAGSPVRTLHGMAAMILAAMRQIQPESQSFCIVGYSIGSMLAYETAIQILGMDDNIVFLGMVDTVWPDQAREQIKKTFCNLKKAMLGPPDEGQDKVAGQHNLLHAVADYEAESSPCIVHSFSTRRTKEHMPDNWSTLLPAHNVCVVQPFPGDQTVGPSDHSTALGSVFANALQAALANTYSLPPERSYASLLSIQVGQAGMCPYFCVPGAGANVADFIAFSDAIGSKYPVHGLQARGLDGRLLPHASVEAAAQSHLESIRRLHPTGGLHVVGHSFGGWIAFELALRLQAQNYPVHSLTLLDSEAPGISKRIGREYSRPEALMALVSLYEQAAGRSSDLKISDFQGNSTQGQLSLLHSRMVTYGLLPARSRPEWLRGIVRSFETAIRTRYHPTGIFYGITRLALVRSRDESDNAADIRKKETIAGWRNLTSRLEYKEQSGNHITLLKPPHIAPVTFWMRGKVKEN